MREILFRGLTIPHNGKKSEWVCGCLVKHTSLASESMDSFYILKDDNSQHQVFKDTIGEYSGFKDKCGCRIFEGDIVSVEGIRRDLDKVATFNIERGMWIAAEEGGQDVPLNDWSRICFIKGNIYEKKTLKNAVV